MQIANGDGTVQAAQAKEACDGAGRRRGRARDRRTGPRRPRCRPGGRPGGRRRRLAAGRLSRRAHRRSPGHAEVPRSNGDAALRVDVNNTGAANADGRLGVPALNAPSSAISAVEEGAPANLGLVAPTGPAARAGRSGSTTCRPWARSHKADGTLVTAGTVLTRRPARPHLRAAGRIRRHGAGRQLQLRSPPPTGAATSAARASRSAR